MTITEDEWRTIFEGAVPDAERDRVLRVACAAFTELLEQEPTALEEISRGLTERLGGAITTETWDPIDRFLMLYAGSDVRYLILWTAIGPDERLPIIDALGSPTAAASLRTLIARHTPRIDDAYKVWREIPENWRSVSREFVDASLTGKVIRISLETFGGQSFVMAGPPVSVMNLTNYLIETLTLLDFEDFEPDGPPILEFKSLVAEAARWAGIAPQEDASDESGNGHATGPPTT